MTESIVDRYIITVDDEEFDVNLSCRNNDYFIECNGDKYNVTVDRLTSEKFLFKVNDCSSEIDITRNNGSLDIFLGGKEMSVMVEPYNLAELRKKAGVVSDGSADKLIKAPMPGLVLKTELNPGDSIEKGDTLVIIEAMKMENMIKSPFSGIVKTVFITPGEVVNKDEKLLELE